MRTRNQIFPWVAPALRKRLRLYASRRGATESAVVEAALKQYLDAEVTDRAVLIRQLNRVERNGSTLQRDFDLLSQAFGVFVQVWFAHTPQIPEGERGSAEQTALRRYQRFLDHVARQLEDGRSFARDILPEAEPDTDVREPSGGGTGDEPTAE